VIPIEAETVLHARNLAHKHPSLSARDLLHLALCHRHNIRELKTFDQDLLREFNRR